MMTPPNLATRQQKKEHTKCRILSAAVSSLIDVGVARTTTTEVQKRAEVSRGALLHHFHTHAELISAAVAEIVKRNEAAVLENHQRLAVISNPIQRSIQTLSIIATEDSFLAEMELWIVSRTNNDLREALIAAEKNAFSDKTRVVDIVFAPLKGHPQYNLVVETTVEFIRGLAISGVLRKKPNKTEQLIDQWIQIIKTILTDPQ